MELRRDELAVRKIYSHLIKSKKLTTFFRPFNRIFPNYRGYKYGEIIKIKIIETVGNDLHDIPPKFSEEEFPAKIISIKAKRFNDISKEDFTGSSPDVTDKQSLLYHLGTIYNLSTEKIEKSEITRIEVRYLLLFE